MRAPATLPRRAPFLGRARLTLAFAIASAACTPRPGGAAVRLPEGQDLAIALGEQRLLVPVQPGKKYRVTATPAPGDSALLIASTCWLDPHQRIDEGDHCLGQAVARQGAVSLATIEPTGRENGLSLTLFSEGPSPGPVLLRLDSEPLQGAEERR